MERLLALSLSDAMNDTLPFAVGDLLENTSPTALARKIRVMAINDRAFTGEVLEGDNLTDPITVFRAGWFLYSKVQP